MKNIIVVFVFLFLTACVAQPNGNHNFSIAPTSVKKGSWSLRHLSTHARIELTGYLLADSGQAASVAFIFGTSQFDYPLAQLTLSDQACEGAYTMELSHRVKAGNLMVDYLSSKLAWESPLQLQVEWWSDGRFSVTINGVESKTVQLTKPVGDLAVEAYFGGIRVDNLRYEDLNHR